METVQKYPSKSCVHFNWFGMNGTIGNTSGCVKNSPVRAQKDFERFVVWFCWRNYFQIQIILMVTMEYPLCASFGIFLLLHLIWIKWKIGAANYQQNVYGWWALCGKFKLELKVFQWIMYNGALLVWALLSTLFIRKYDHKLNEYHKQKSKIESSETIEIK